MPRKRITWTHFTRRTNYPKLGYIIYRLKCAGIPCRFAPFPSFHAPIVDIPTDCEKAAWDILAERYGTIILDDMDDDAPCFRRFADEKPSHKTRTERRTP